MEMKNDRKVSIIIPVYNVERYVRKCIESILKQTYENIEIIIVNDGSSDKTEEICRLFEKKDSRIFLHNLENGGVSKARNYGIQNSTGEYIVFVDGDDFVDSKYIEMLVNSFGSKDVGLGIVDYYIFENNKIYTISPNDSSVTYLTNKQALDMITKHNFFEGYLWNKIFVREIVLKYKLKFDERVKIWEDLLFCAQYLMNDFKVCYNRKALYYYVKRTDSAISNKKVWNEMTHWIALEQLYDIAVKSDGVFLEDISSLYNNNMIGMLAKGEDINLQEIKKKIQLSKQIGGKLTTKHKVKYFLLKYCPQMFLLIRKVRARMRKGNT